MWSSRPTCTRAPWPTITPCLFPADGTVSSESIAKRENGVVQTIGDWNIVLSPRRGYIAVPARGIVGVSSTMPRQDFVRWVRAARNPDKPAIAPYLQDAVAAHKNAHILIATDLDNLFDPTLLRQALQRTGEVSNESELNSLVNVLSGARGLTFTAQIGDATKAELRIDFAVPMADFVTPLKRVWPKALEAADFEVPEFKSADVKADGKSVVLTATVGDTSLRRILSLIRSPGDAVGSKDEAANGLRTPKEGATLAASLRYYKAVNSALDDLRGQGGRQEQGLYPLGNVLRDLCWPDREAHHSDVDPALVQYGASVSAKLARDGWFASRRQGPARSVRQLQVHDLRNLWSGTVCRPVGLGRRPECRDEHQC